jgi:hypothetical protein
MKKPQMTVGRHICTYADMHIFKAVTWLGLLALCQCFGTKSYLRLQSTDVTFLLVIDPNVNSSLTL